MGIKTFMAPQLGSIKTHLARFNTLLALRRQQSDKLCSGVLYIIRKGGINGIPRQHYRCANLQRKWLFPKQIA
jgi:hypothetical protein